MDSKVITKIKNTASGSIQLLNASDEIVRILQPIGLTAHGIREGQANEGVCIMNAGGHQEAVLVTANITDYEIYPAASTPFTGTTEDLKALLAESFFFSVSGGGGGANGDITIPSGSILIENPGTGLITPTIPVTQNNWNPTGLSTALWVNIAAGAASALTGIQAQQDGRVLYLYNSGSFSINLSNNNVLSTPANRLSTANLTVSVLTPQDVAKFTYRASLARWVVQRTV